MDLKYLVVGTGRSGTVFMARLLTSLNIPCSHEMIFNYCGLECAIARIQGKEPLQLSWVSRATYDQGKWQENSPWLPDLNNVIAESSYMAAPYLKCEILKSTKIIHTVRNPIKVVNSYCNYIDFFKSSEANNSYEQFVYNNIPELKTEMPQHDRGALFWVRWNQMIENSQPHYFHRIEDGVEGVMKFLNVEGEHFNDTSVNTLKKPISEKFSILKIQSKIIKEEFVAMGRKYGYSMASDNMFI